MSGTSPTDFASASRQSRPALNKVVAQKKIAGRVAAEKKLRREDEFRALTHRFAIRLLQPRAVLIERADGGVELEKADAHDD